MITGLFRGRLGVVYETIKKSASPGYERPKLEGCRGVAAHDNGPLGPGRSGVENRESPPPRRPLDRPTLTEWRNCAAQLAAAYEELVESNYLDAADKVIANSCALARFRRLQERSA